MPSRAWAKEAVFPSERFPGAATRGPEMRSTGEVMAGAATAVRGLRARGARRGPLEAGRQDRAAAPGGGATLSRGGGAPGRHRGDGRGREDRSRDRHRHDPLGAAAAGREDGRPRGRHASRARSPAAASRPTSSSARSRSSPAARPAASTTASPTARPGRSGSPAAARSTSGSRRPIPSSGARFASLLDEDGYGMLYTDTNTGEKRLERGVLESTGPARRRRLRRGDRGPAPRRRSSAPRRPPSRSAPTASSSAGAPPSSTRAPRSRRPERVPSADEIVKAWPDEVADRIDERTVVVTLSHEERLDIPAIAEALRRNARYVGAIGAKRDAGAPPRCAARAGLLRGRPRPDPRPRGSRPRRPRPGAGRARDRGGDRLGHLGRPRQGQGSRRRG